MSLTVVLVVLGAAFCHAVWNVILKSRGDRLTGIAQMNILVGLLALPVLFFVDAPAAESWPYLAASVALHTGYKLFLVRAYGAGDMSQVYPIARGAAPLIVALATWILIGEILTANGYLGVAAICTGLIGLSVFGGGRLTENPRALLFALGTAGFIAAYSTVDGIGARLSGSAHGYAALLFVCDAVPIALIAVARRGGRTVLRPVSGNWLAAVASAALSLFAFWAVIWAMTVAPIATVAALRETSVIIGVILGALILREGSFIARIPAAICVAAGAVLLQF